MTVQILEVSNASFGETYRCMGSTGYNGIQMWVSFQLDGQRCFAKLDGFFRSRLGWLTRPVRKAIVVTAPVTIEVSTRNHKDCWGKTTVLYIASRKDLSVWLDRAKAHLAQQKVPS